METTLSPQFAALPAHTKVWVWQSVQPLDAHRDRIASVMDPFVQGWQSHGTPVKGAWQVLHGHFLVVAGASFDAVSGCSTDTLQRAIQQVAQATGLDLHDRMKVGLLGEDGRVQFKPLKQVRNGDLDAAPYSYKMFDLTITTLDQLLNGWPVPLVGSWAEPKQVTT